MKLKLFELRDRATFIPIFAFRATAKPDLSDHGLTAANEDFAQESWLFRRAGFGWNSHCVIVGRLECSGVDRNCTYDPYAWGGRTYPVAHKYIEEHFDELQSGQVLDVEFILGDTTTPKLSEAVDPFGELPRRDAQTETSAPSTHVEALSPGELQQ